MYKLYNNIVPINTRYISMSLANKLSLNYGSLFWSTALYTTSHWHIATRSNRYTKPL